MFLSPVLRRRASLVLLGTAAFVLGALGGFEGLLERSAERLFPAPDLARVRVDLHRMRARVNRERQTKLSSTKLSERIVRDRAQALRPMRRSR